MSGHSKWASIKHKKAAIDSKKGKIFNKLNREITVAARIGGGDMEGNPRLRLVVQKARNENMPMENIERAIKKGTGELEGVSYEEKMFEGYGPNGTAIIIDTLTDNNNRTTAEIRSLFSKNNGNMGSSGSVAWMFSKKGLIMVKNEGVTEDSLFNIAVDAGAEDIKLDEETNIFDITCEPENFEAVKKALETNKIKIEESEITLIPKNYVKIEDESVAKQMVRLINALEDQDDCQNVYTNADIPADILEGE